MSIQSLLQSRLVTAGLVVLLSAVIAMAGKLYLQKRAVESEISRLQEQAQELSGENQQLTDLIQYLNTPEYKEREAREKLNLKKPGEQVVVLPGPEKTTDQPEANQDMSNPEKWYRYFFKETWN